MAERNPDEFSYGMLNSHSRKGRKSAGRQNPVLNQDVVKLLKTQDAGYVASMLQKAKQAQARLEQGFVLNEGKGVELLGAFSSQKKGRHKIFVDSREQQRQCKTEAKAALQPDSTRRLGYPSENKEEDDSAEVPFVYLPQEPPAACGAGGRQELASKHDKALRKCRRKEQDARKLKLAAMNAREKDLLEAKNELDLQRAKMSNNVGGTNKIGIQWKARERKK